MPYSEFIQTYHANVRSNIVGLQIRLHEKEFVVMRQSTEISAFPGYEVYVRCVEEE